MTGASRGIGWGVAQCFSEAGGDLHLAADDPVVEERAFSVGARGVVADIRDRQAVAAALAPIGRINVR